MKKILYLLTFLALFYAANSQEITWSNNIKTNPWAGGIVAKYQGKLITFYSERRSADRTNCQLYIYDSAMRLQQKIPLPLPPGILGQKFFVYKDFFYVIYHVQHKDTVYLDAVKIRFDGKMEGGVYHLDKTKTVDYDARMIYFNSYIYSIVASEDQKHLLAFKIDNYEGNNTVLTTLLFNDSLRLQHRSDIYAPLVDGVDFFSDFNIDNDGNLVFLRNREVTDMADAAKHTVMIIKNPLDDSLYIINIILDDIRAADMHIRIDNMHKKYIISTFYSSTSKRNIDGLYCLLWGRGEEGDDNCKEGGA